MAICHTDRLERVSIYIDQAELTQAIEEFVRREANLGELDGSSSYTFVSVKISNVGGNEELTADVVFERSLSE